MKNQKYFFSAITVISLVLMVTLGWVYLVYGTTIGTNISTGNLTSSGTVSGTWQGTVIGADYGGTATDTSAWTGVIYLTSGTWGTSTVDISDWTNLTAGRSLTLTGDDLAADAELYTKTITYVVRNATTTKNPAGAYFTVNALTIAEVGCYTDSGTSSIQFDERGEGSPMTAGSDILSASLECDTNGASSTSFSDSAIAARKWISLDIDAVTNSTNTTAYIKYTIDD